MSSHRLISVVQSALVVAGLAVGLAMLGGCKKADEIREYAVKSSPLPAPTHRMLAAIVPDELRQDAAATAPLGSDKEKTADQRGPQAWFFKLVGPSEQVEKVAKAFDQFVASVRTGKEGLPEWTLPEGWSEDPAARAPQFGREATIRISQDGAELELTVSKLPMSSERREGWIAGNINRWRNQLQLPPIARSELDEYTEEIKAGDQTAIKVDFRGTYSGTSGMAAAAKLAHGGPRAPAATGEPPRRAAESRPLPFDAEVPADWKPGQLNEFRVAAYNVASDDGSMAAEVTVTPLGPAAGDLRANVDRWRQEIKLPAASPEQLEQETKSIEVAGQKADYVHLVGPEGASPREATLAVILRRPDRVWFFKLRGQADVVKREKQQFEEFVKSVKFK